MILDATRSAGALTFLRANLTPAEQLWISVDPWMVKSSKADGIAKLRALASAALEFVER
jgi:hypothetical protein